MLAKILAPARIGLEGALVEVECDITNGLPSLIVVGLGNQAVNEARDRVRSALRNSNLLLPPKRVTLNLAPADLPKDGTAFDLAIAIAVLVASDQLDPPEPCLLAGELALDGTLRPVRGVLAHAELAASHGIERLFVPQANAAEASLIEGVTVYAATNLMEIYAHLAGLRPLAPVSPPKLSGGSTSLEVPDFATIHGQPEAKRVLEIAAAGGHNVLLTGPPGTGKTMLSRALIGILPPPDIHEMIAITKIHSLAGKSVGTIMTERPFRNPHHTASDIALIGGGRNPKPGEISLSHKGVLFLDELPEFRRDVLETLRQPLEDGVITVARAAGSVTFPAEFMLIAAQNPCPCGYAGDPVRTCVCTQAAIGRYTTKVSGPLLDRIDMKVQVNRVDLSKSLRAEASSTVARRVVRARELQHHSDGSLTLNARRSGHEIQKSTRLSREARAMLTRAMQNLQLSARAYIRIVRVAQTIAHLSGRTSILPDDVAEAVRYRPTA